MCVHLDSSAAFADLSAVFGSLGCTNSRTWVGKSTYLVECSTVGCYTGSARCCCSLLYTGKQCLASIGMMAIGPGCYFVQAPCSHPVFLARLEMVLLPKTASWQQVTGV